MLAGRCLGWVISPLCEWRRQLSPHRTLERSQWSRGQRLHGQQEVLSSVPPHCLVSPEAKAKEGALPTRQREAGSGERLLWRGMVPKGQRQYFPRLIFQGQKTLPVSSVTAKIQIQFQYAKFGINLSVEGKLSHSQNPMKFFTIISSQTIFNCVWK